MRQDDINKLWKIVDKLIIDSFGKYCLDDLLELLSDFWLLNFKWENVRKLAWRKVYKWTETEKDRFEKSWETFDEYTKEFLIKHIDEVNSEAKRFLLSLK